MFTENVLEIKLDRDALNKCVLKKEISKNVYNIRESIKRCIKNYFWFVKYQIIFWDTDFHCFPYGTDTVNGGAICNSATCVESRTLKN